MSGQTTISQWEGESREISAHVVDSMYEFKFNNYIVSLKDVKSCYNGIIKLSYFFKF